MYMALSWEILPDLERRYGEAFFVLGASMHILPVRNPG
jgi:hypothetical protein